jgi:anti-sigma factor (TIGR02949 family)
MEEYVDRELAPQEVALVRAHLDACAACAAEFTFEEDVLLRIRAKLQGVDIPMDLRERIARLLIDMR